MEFELSTYQKEIINTFKNTTDNIFIDALAGSAKTYMLIEISKLINDYSVFMAFNKSIQLELENKISNPKFKTYTFNGLGYLIMIKNCESKKISINIDKYKTANVVKKVLSENYYGFKEKKWDIQKKYIDEISSLYEFFKVKYCEIKEENVKFIIKNYDLFSDNEIEVPKEIVKYLKYIDKLNFIVFEKDGTISFSDQLYITLKKLENKEWTVPPYLLFNHILLDETQDLNVCQQKLVFYIQRKNARIVGVGDKNQAIYGFNGADSNSINNLKRMFNMTVLSLPINYRCPKSHLDYVNKQYDIGIQPAPNAINGNISTIDKCEMYSIVKNGDFILSRKNKDLCSIILGLLENGKSVYFKDSNFVNKMVSSIKGYSKNISSLDNLYLKIIETRNKCKQKFKKTLKEMVENGTFDSEKVEKYNFSNDIVDLFDCIEILLNNYKTKSKETSIDGFLLYVQKMLNCDNKNNSIICSSIHQTKGLETKNVFVLNEAKPMYELGRTTDQRIQERNLSYIALTRAKENLYLVYGD